MLELLSHPIYTGGSRIGYFYNRVTQRGSPKTAEACNIKTKNTFINILFYIFTCITKVSNKEEKWGHVRIPPKSANDPTSGL